MKRLQICALSLALIGGIASCSEDKKEDPAPKTRAELLMAKSWSVTGETETVGSTTTDVFADNYEACELDDTFKFLAGSILTYDQGKIKCDPNEDQSITGSWALSENDNKLAFLVFIFGREAKIEELTDTKLVLSTLPHYFCWLEFNELRQSVVIAPSFVQLRG